MLPGSVDIYNQLVAGTLDAGVISPPFDTMASQKGLHEVAFIGDALQTPYQGYGSTTTFISEHRPQVVAMLRAAIDARDWLKTHPEEGGALVAKYTGSPPDVVGPSLEKMLPFLGRTRRIARGWRAAGAGHPHQGDGHASRCHARPGRGLRPATRSHKQELTRGRGDGPSRRRAGDCSLRHLDDATCRPRITKCYAYMLAELGATAPMRNSAKASADGDGWGARHHNRPIRRTARGLSMAIQSMLVPTAISGVTATPLPARTISRSTSVWLVSNTTRGLNPASRQRSGK